MIRTKSSIYLRGTLTLEKFPKLPKHIIHDGVKWLMVPAKVMVDAASEWPENQNNVTRILHVLCLASQLFAAFGHFYCFISKDSNLVSNADAIIYFVICLESATRRIILYLNREQLCQILTKVYFSFWPSNKFGHELNNELTKQSKYIFYYCIFYTTSAFLCTMQFMTTPFSEGSLPLKTRYPFPWQESPYYELLYVWQAFLCLEIVFSVCAVDIFFIGLVCNCIAQFKLLKEYLLSNYDKTVQEQNDDYHQTDTKLMLGLFIKRHIELMKTCQEIDSIFSSFILIQCLASIGTVCLSCFIMTAKPELIRIAFPYLIGHMCELFIYCYMGNDLMIESTEIANAAFECGWHVSSHETYFQKTLTMIMIRAQKPIRLSTGGFGYLSLDGFLNLVKFSFSVYTLLKNMLMKQDFDY